MIQAESCKSCMMEWYIVTISILMEYLKPRKYTATKMIRYDLNKLWPTLAMILRKVNDFNVKIIGILPWKDLVEKDFTLKQRKCGDFEHFPHISPSLQRHFVPVTSTHLALRCVSWCPHCKRDVCWSLWFDDPEILPTLRHACIWTSKTITFIFSTRHWMVSLLAAILVNEYSLVWAANQRPILDGDRQKFKLKQEIEEVEDFQSGRNNHVKSIE